MNKKKKKITWVDAISYYNLEEMPKKLPQKETVGEIVKEDNSFIIIKSPKTEGYDPDSHRSVTEKEKLPTFLFVPKSFVLKIEDLL